jgi:2-iminobutanoate/2-iminopropanoate deaminase
MAATIIQTPKAPAAIGPYSQAIQANGFLFTSGQLGIDPASGTLPPDIAGQTKQSLQNLGAILEEAGYQKSDVIKTVIFLKNMSDFATVNEIYAAFFGDHKPARSCIEVAALPKNGLIEIEAVAALG